MQGWQACRLSDCHETHVRVERRCAFCLGAVGETPRTLASLAAHEEEIPRDAEGSAVHQIRGRAVRVFPPGCSDAEEYERELIHPAWALKASLEGPLQLSVKTLHETVGLRAVSRRVGGGDPQQLVEFNS